MEILYIVNEIVEVLFLIIGLKGLQDICCKFKGTYIRLVTNISIIIIWTLLCVVMYHMQGIFLVLRIIIVFIYVYIIYKSNFLDTFLKVIVLFTFIDVLNLLVVLMTYPIATKIGIDSESNILVIISFAGHMISYLIALIIIYERRPHALWNIFVGAKRGIFIICVVVEIFFLAFKTLDFNQNNITIYLLWIAFIVFGITILTLWLRDRKKQHDKFSELIKYEHRTREIIPAIEKALQDLKNMGLTKAGEQRMIAELEAICKSDRSCLRGRNRQVRSFETTGSPILDNQLEQFVEECEENGILLDVIVRAEITAFLDLEDVEILTVLQIVGDLYRNAFKAVSKNKEKKNLLICFGYNANDYYEIGIYDNGHPFPSQIKEQLGVRGVTVDGTGHGMADVFEHLHRHQASFVLEENPAKGFTFTKGIHIVFDEKDRMEILS